MKYKILFLLAFILLIGFSACKDEDQPGVDFSITYKATYGGEQLKKNTDFLFGAFPLEFIRYRLYLSDITLLKSSGEEVRLAEVEYLDFFPDVASTNLSATPQITYQHIPEGTYSGIRIGYGVKAALNAKKPSDFPSGHPLSDETDYWSGWKSYIFSVLDGKADPENDGSKNLTFSYHCGSDAVYKTFTFNEEIQVASGQPRIELSFDVLKFLTNDDGSLYDIQAKPATSNNASDVQVALELMPNYAHATTVKQL